MAFGATLTVTVNAVAKVLNRVKQDEYTSEYLLVTTLEEFRVSIRHVKESVPSNGIRMDRHQVTMRHTVFATSTVPEKFREVSSTYRIPYADDLTQAGYDVAAFGALLNGSTLQGDLLTWQS